MKLLKITLIATLLTWVDSVVIAQEQGDLTVGLNVIYTRGLKEEGLNIGVEYMFIDRFAVSPSWSSYLVDPMASLNSLNIDFRYYTPLSGKLKVYTVLGINRSTIKQDIEFFGIPIGTAENSQTGLNAGLGAYLSLTEHLGVHTQLKYATALIDEAVIQAGVFYKIK